VAAAVTDDDYQLFLRHCFQESRAAVEEEALSRGLTPRDLATTLIVLVAKGDLVAAGQIGDGACVVGNCGEPPVILNPPQFGEYINETIFLTSNNALDELQISIWRGRAHSIACFCDGLQSLALKLPEGTPHRPFFAPLFHFIAGSDARSEPTKELVSFLRSPRVQERSDDDLTLILVHHS
jgi:hypothetical protein